MNFLQTSGGNGAIACSPVIGAKAHLAFFTAQRLGWAAKQPLGNVALGALFAPTHSSTRGLRPPEQLERPAGPRHLFLELPREFLLSGICCSTSGSTEGAIGDRLFRTQEADAVHISMWVACRAPYTSVHLVCLRQPQCERLERVAPQKPLVSGGHIIRVPSIYLSQSFPNVPLRIGKIYMFPNILWSVMQRAQFSSVAQLCLTLCDPMDCSMQEGMAIHSSILAWRIP